jgi:predicted GNAT superfamily acetyltransferase
MEDTYEIRPLEPQEMLECAPLSASRFGFSELEQIPPWVMQTMQWAGGFALGAFEDDHLLGYSIAFPAVRNGHLFLMSMGLAVQEAFESRGIGMALKFAQRHHAMTAGFQRITWTTMSLNARPLYVYLRKLGARLTAIHPDMYAATLGMPIPDEVQLDWELDKFPVDTHQAPAAEFVTKSRPLDDSLRTLTDTDLTLVGPGSPTAYLVEIPWDVAALHRAAPGAAEGWAVLVRATMRRLLEAGYVGTDVRLDRTNRQAWVQFEHRTALS